MKRYLAVALVCLILLSALAGCKDTKAAQQLADLEAEKAQLSLQIQDLNLQVEDLTSQLDALNALRLSAWELQPIVGEQIGHPVSVKLTAEPAAYQPNQQAVFLVMLDGNEAASVPCQWDGTAYTAAASLEPADGYGYYCILTNANGTEETITLCTPDNTTNSYLTSLSASLETYCNLVVTDWEADDEYLTILSGSGMIQLPLLTTDGEQIKCTAAHLVLKMADEVLDDQELPIQEGETENNFLVPIQDISFEIPEMEDEDQLDLWLTVTLSNGSEMTAAGGSWYLSSGSLDLIAG